MAMDLVRITNPAQPGDPNYRTLHMVHQDEVIDIPPGGERIVRFEIAQSFFGHPKAHDTPKDRVRRDTYEYLRAMWNYQLGATDAAERWEKDRPPFKVLTLEGEYLPMVLDDPDGKLPLPGEDESEYQTADPSVAALQQALAETQARATRLEEMMAGLVASQNPGVVPIADAPVDPTNLPQPIINEDGPVADSPRQASTRRTR